MQILVNRRVATVTVAALMGLLAALPAAPASAASGPAVHPLTAPGGASYTANWLSGEEVEGLLGELPLNELPIGGSGAISPEALIEALEALPGFEALGGEELNALKEAIEGLGSGATLQILEDPSSLVSGLESALENVLGGLGLGGLLGGGESTEQVTEVLEEALKQVNVEELLSQLLGSSQSPEALVEELLDLLPIEQILGHPLGGSPVSTQTLEELAKELGETSEELAEELEASGEALTTELANGELLTVVNSAGKLVVGTLDKTLGGLPGGNEGSEKETSKEETGKETEANEKETTTERETKERETIERETKEKEASAKETGEGTSKGSGSGSTSGAGGTGGTQVTVNLPPHGANATVSKAKRKKKTVGKIVVLKHRVHAGVAKIVVHTPGAGRITAHNRDIRAVRRRVGRARRLTFEVVLSRAGKASLTHHRRARRLRLRIVFVPTHGLRSHAILKLRFR